MRRFLIIAALVVLLSLPAFCQRGGGRGASGHAGAAMGGRGFVGGGHPGFAGHGARVAMAGRGRGFGSFRAGGIRFGGRSGHAFSHDRFHDGFHDGFHDRFHHRFRGWGFPWAYYGYYVDPWLFDDYGDHSDYQPSYGYGNGYYDQANYQSSYDQSSLILQGEIDQLNQEISRLHEERESRNPQTSQQNAGLQSAPKAEIHGETVLVFRDKHTQEVQNYAIVGKTLWVFDEQHAKKIPLADLDISATMKANEDRGIDFRVPTLNS